MAVQFYNYSGAINSSSVTTSDDVTVGDDLTVTDDATIADLSVTGTLTVAGNAIVGANSALVPADQGYKAWTFPLTLAAGGTALATAGTLYLARIRRVPAGNITNLITYVNVAGNTLTSGQCFGALYTAAGALIGQTADQASAWGSAGVKTAALAGGPFAVSAGDLYAGFWFNGTTGPQMYRASTGFSGAIPNAGLTAPNLAAARADTGLTTTAPSTIGAQSADAVLYFVAVS